MSDISIAEEERATPSLLDRPLAGLLARRGEILTYCLIAAAAAAMRLWDLGSRALHHDESLHALYSWNLYQGRGYEHHPMMHGPFQFHGNALIFFLFGDSDYTSRLLYVLFGTAIIFLPYFLRAHLGKTGALLTGLLLAISPSFMYYSRFARNDILIAVWNMLLLIGIWGYIRERKPKYLYLLAAALSLSFATKETTYLTVLILGGYLFLMSGRSILGNLAHRFRLSDLSPAGVMTLLMATLALPQGAAAAQVIWKSELLQDKLRIKVSETATVFGSVTQEQLAAAIVVVVLVAITALIAWRWNISVWLRCAIIFYAIYILLFTTFFTNPKGFATGIWGSLDYWMDQQDVRRGEQPWYYFLILLPLYEFVPMGLGIIAAVYYGLRGRLTALATGSLAVGALGILAFLANYLLGRQDMSVRGLPTMASIFLLAIAAAVFALVIKVRRESFSVGLGALFLVVVGGLVLVLGTVMGARSDEALRTSLPLIPAFIAIALAVVFFVAAFPTGKDDFVRFLIFFSGMSFVAYSLAGEKMPWLSLHMALPLILLAGFLLGRVWEHVDWARLWQRGGGYLLLVALALLVGLRSVLGGSQGVGWLVLGLLALTAFGAGAVAMFRRDLGIRQIGLASVVVFAAIMSLFSFRTGWRASIHHGDTPQDMLIYTQSSPDIPRIMREIDRLAAQTGEGLNLPVTVDSDNGYSWPWAWYLRYYKKVDYPTMTSVRSEPAGKVLLLASSNLAAAQGYLDKYGAGTTYRHRWWFPEDTYKGLTAEKFWKQLTDPKTLSDWWRFFVFRQPKSSLGSSDAIVYFTADYRPSDPMLAKAEASSASTLPQRELTVRQVFGSFGTQPGQFNEPKGVAVDILGNVYVTDGINNRLQKFSPAGVLIKAVGQKGNGPGQFNEPWAVAVDARGDVYVADTWNHRIQKFDAELNYVAEWGGLGLVGEGPVTDKAGQFFGPRSIALDKEGNLYVTDTGNKRVQKFTSAGVFLGAWGGKGTTPGLMDEPVGIAIDSNGDILVADTWNRRIQRFDASFQPKAQFSIAPAWQGQSVVNKPYLAVDRQGNIVTTDPLGRRILRFSSEGTLLSASGGPGAGPFQLPIGLAVDGDGNIFVVDSARHTVTRYAPVE